MTVLILGRDLDPSVDRLVEALGEREVPVFRTDLAAFPKALTLDARLGPHGWDGVLATPHREVRLHDIRSVWYRHPSHFELSAGMSGPERRHATAEARCGLSGVREFARSVAGPLAGKTLTAALLVESGRLQTAYTRRIEQPELDDLSGVNTTLHFFQPFVPKLFEARVTVVGDQVFGAAIHAGSDAARVDFRSDYDNLDYSVVEPPQPVIVGMLSLMKTFGLSFGAFDFAVTPDQEWVMFECNPAGAFGWLEDALHLPITAAVADLLANGAAG
jgi:MvdD pre-ATP grasp domain